MNSDLNDYIKMLIQSSLAFAIGYYLFITREKYHDRRETLKRSRLIKGLQKIIFLKIHDLNCFSVPEKVKRWEHNQDIKIEVGTLKEILVRLIEIVQAKESRLLQSLIELEKLGIIKSSFEADDIDFSNKVSMLYGVLVVGSPMTKRTLNEIAWAGSKNQFTAPDDKKTLVSIVHELHIMNTHFSTAIRNFDSENCDYSGPLDIESTLISYLLAPSPCPLLNDYSDSSQMESFIKFAKAQDSIK